MEFKGANDNWTLKIGFQLQLESIWEASDKWTLGTNDNWILRNNANDNWTLE